MTTEPIDLDRERAKRPLLTGPVGLPSLKKVALHYEATFASDQKEPLFFKLDHLSEHRDEFFGELTISYAPAGTVGGVLCWLKLNLLSLTARSGLAKKLKEKVEADWDQYIDLFCRAVAEREREGVKVAQPTQHQTARAAEYLLDPILPMGLPTVLYGPGGVGKSTVAAAMAFSIQTGIEIIKGWKPVSAPVLILDWEGRQEDWTQRWEMIARGLNVAFAPFHYRASRRRLKDDIELLADYIVDNSIGLVVVDSVSLAFGLSSYQEADPSEMAIKAFGAIRDVGDITWLLIDHVTGQNLNDGEVATKAYGSVKKRDLARQMFHVSGPTDPGEGDQALVMTHTKANYSAYLKPIGINVSRTEYSMTFNRTDSFDSLDLDTKLSMSDRIRRELKQSAVRQDRLKELLGIEAKDKREQNAFRQAIFSLRKRERIVQLKDGSLGLPAGDQGELC